ncbi:hypothetical protein F4803DRAFT_578099 [Xylaria telfairii]|nr:hypothetical protein F4803DRAFT_578099 [Xylaria telfairii]
MPEHLAKSYAERSRHDRRVELARLAQERHTDASVIVGLSWRFNGHQAHIDYTGGIDMATAPRRLVASFGNTVLNWLLSCFCSAWQAGKATGKPRSRGVLGPEQRRLQVPGWMDALVRAAPVDSQQRRPTSEEAAKALQGRNTVAGNERRVRDFAAVLARVDTAALATLARDLLEERRRHHLRPSRSSTDPVPLPQIGEPFFGSGHVFYTIRFHNGVRWIAKIPAVLDELCRETLRAEALLLHKLRTETAVPVPEVIDADCGDNAVGVPWLLMGFVRGRRLDDVWFGHETPGLMERRKTILRNVADAMLRLGKYEFDRGGALVFDQKDGELVGAGPLRLLDVQAMVDRWSADQDCDATPVYRTAGPWDRAADMYTAWLDAYPPASVAARGVDELLRLLLSHVREPAAPSMSPSSTPRGIRSDEKKFVLAHPDLSMRHIVLAEDGTTVKAILGWDGARAAPRSMGCEALPRWLVRDFDPFVWRWSPPVDPWRLGLVLPEVNLSEDPPWVLRELRGYYARVMGELKRGSGVRRDDVDVTKQSLLALTLDAAIRDPRCRVVVLRRVMEKCSRPFEELDFDFFVEVLGEGCEVDSLRLRFLADNLMELVDKGFVKGAVVW